ncbi:MAG: Peptidase propeptide, partial [Frankiales bacterium]|nr:Peptidase propeptide [Frankiales bacterium]
ASPPPAATASPSATPSLTPSPTPSPQPEPQPEPEPQPQPQPQPAPPPPSPAPTASSLPSGATLAPDQSLRSPNGQHLLAMQGDGNLVLYLGSTARWSTRTAGRPGARLVMQSDGNLVLYATDGRALWSTFTDGRGPSTLHVQDDGNVVVYVDGGGASWSAGTTVGSGPPPATGGDDYPDRDAVDCSAQYGVYSWCKGGTWLSPRRFAYRNCTDWVSFKIGRNWSDINSGGDGNARGWRQGWIDRGRAVGSTPRVGSVAWWGSSTGGGFGHVALVTAVNGDGSATVTEYNQRGDGTYGTRTGVRAEAYLY